MTMGELEKALRRLKTIGGKCVQVSAFKEEGVWVYCVVAEGNAFKNEHLEEAIGMFTEHIRLECVARTQGLEL